MKIDLTTYETPDDYLKEWRSGWDYSGEVYVPVGVPILPDGAVLLFAYYTDEDYSGSAFAVFEAADGALWEINGSHCSCYGLEGQWQPEQTTTAALRMRDVYIFHSNDDRGALMVQLHAVLDDYDTRHPKK